MDEERFWDCIRAIGYRLYDKAGGVSSELSEAIREKDLSKLEATRECSHEWADGVKRHYDSSYIDLGDR